MLVSDGVGSAEVVCYKHVHLTVFPLMKHDLVNTIATIEVTSLRHEQKTDQIFFLLKTFKILEEGNFVCNIRNTLNVYKIGEPRNSVNVIDTEVRASQKYSLSNTAHIENRNFEENLTLTGKYFQTPATKRHKSSDSRTTFPSKVSLPKRCGPRVSFPPRSPLAGPAIRRCGQSLAAEQHSVV